MDTIFAETYIKGYVHCRVTGQFTKTRKLHKLLIRGLQYTKEDLDLFVEERYIELDQSLDHLLNKYI